MDTLNAVNCGENQHIPFCQDSEYQGFENVKLSQSPPLDSVKIKMEPSFLSNSNVQSDLVYSQEGIFDSNNIRLEPNAHQERLESPGPYIISSHSEGSYVGRNNKPQVLSLSLGILLLPENLTKLKSLIIACTSNPEILYMHQLSFLKEYLESLGATIPAKVPSITEQCLINKKLNSVRPTAMQESESSDQISNFIPEKDDFKIQLHNIDQNITTKEMPYQCNQSTVMHQIESSEHNSNPIAEVKDFKVDLHDIDQNIPTKEMSYHYDQSPVMQQSDSSEHISNPFAVVKYLSIELQDTDQNITSEEQPNQCNQSTVMQQSESSEHITNPITEPNVTEIEFGNRVQNIIKEIQSERPHMCPLCGNAYLHKSSLQYHLRTNHRNGRQSRSYSITQKKIINRLKTKYCSDCDMSFQYNEGLTIHKLITHGKKTR